MWAPHLGLVVLRVEAHAPPPLCVADVGAGRVRRGQRQRMLQLRRRPQDAQRVVGQLLVPQTNRAQIS